MCELFSQGFMRTSGGINPMNHVAHLQPVFVHVVILKAIELGNYLVHVGQRDCTYS
jgi:hypothetical protein